MYLRVQVRYKLKIAMHQVKLETMDGNSILIILLIAMGANIKISRIIQALKQGGVIATDQACMNLMNSEARERIEISLKLLSRS
jgi:hypothetical protein